MPEKVWGGRFKEDIEEKFHNFNTSIGFDWRLYPYDIMGSIAHTKALKRAGILSDSEEKIIIETLNAIKEDLDAEKLKFDTKYEDIHTFIEKELVKRAGEVGEKLHTGRSRNDQVALDFRLFVKESSKKLTDKIRALQRTIVETAEKSIHILMPGYTHLQRAQVVLLSHHLMAYYEMLEKDRARFKHTYKSADVLPLGSGALAGISFLIEREFVGKELGFSHISRNSMDAVSDRDFALEFIFSCSVLMMHLSRLSEELILWTTKEFSFVELPDSLSTGSSIMPQKKNPDLPELIRGKTGRVYGNLISILTTMKGLPLTYNKDMQEDKEPLFDSFDTALNCLEMMTMLISKLKFNEQKMKDATQEDFLVATDLADYLVTKSVPFRKAHQIVGQVVLYAMEKGKELHELELNELKSFSGLIEEDVFNWLNPLDSANRKSLFGGTSKENVLMRIRQAKEELKT